MAHLPCNRPLCNRNRNRPCNCNRPLCNRNRPLCNRNRPLCNRNRPPVQPMGLCGASGVYNRLSCPCSGLSDRPTCPLHPSCAAAPCGGRSDRPASCAPCTPRVQPRLVGGCSAPCSPLVRMHRTPLLYVCTLHLSYSYAPCLFNLHRIPLFLICTVYPSLIYTTTARPSCTAASHSWVGLDGR